MIVSVGHVSHMIVSVGHVSHMIVSVGHVSHMIVSVGHVIASEAKQTNLKCQRLKIAQVGLLRFARNDAMRGNPLTAQCVTTH